VVEAVRGVPYDKVTDPGVIDRLKAVPGLAGTAGANYTIRRGKTTFAIAVDVCVMDDPRDGGGPHSIGTPVCAGSAPAGMADRNPEDYKMAKVTVTWSRAGGPTRTVTQTGLITNPGSASGPAVRSIAPRGFSAPYVITGAATTSMIVDITVSSKPAALNWLLDGTVQQPSPIMNGTSGLLWTFTWNIGTTETGVLDGDYILSSEAFNEYGVSGPGRQETVILNRRQPFKPRQVTGGRTIFGTVEVEWTANSERDIAGYEVWRDGASTPVCPLAQQKLDTICVDTAPPSDPTVNYWVYAYDTDPSTRQLRRGDRSDLLAVVTANQRPYAPTNLSLTSAADGTVRLTWRRPSPEDKDPGDGIEFYRIYRDGKSLSDRYDRWFDNGSTVTWQDTDTADKHHDYWVTAVDKHYAESVLLGPVTS
jgi:hypothetical protein